MSLTFKKHQLRPDKVKELCSMQKISMVLLTYNLLYKHILKKDHLYKPGIPESLVSKMLHKDHLFL